MKIACFSLSQALSLSAKTRVCCLNGTPLGRGGERHDGPDANQRLGAHRDELSGRRRAHQQERGSHLLRMSAGKASCFKSGKTGD